MRVLRERLARGETVDADAWPVVPPASGLLQEQSNEADTARFKIIELDEDEDEEEVLATIAARRAARARHAAATGAEDDGARASVAGDAAEAPAVTPLPNPACVPVNTAARWKFAIRDLSSPTSPTVVRDRDGTLRHATATEEAGRSWTPRPSRYSHF